MAAWTPILVELQAFSPQLFLMVDEALNEAINNNPYLGRSATVKWREEVKKNFDKDTDKKLLVFFLL
jgi:hypothetical protein